MPVVAPYGSWRSPITPELVTARSIQIGHVACEGETIYWLEVRPHEQGRGVIIQCMPDGTRQEVTPPPFHVRTTVHEYGGGDFCVGNGMVYFSNFADQRLYACRPGETPRPITPEGPFRYADGIYDPYHHRLICVCEDHTVDQPSQVVNTLIAIDLEQGQIQTLVSGSDFYASPRLSPDGKSLAWLEWDHPNMPWNGTRLILAKIRPDGSLESPQLVAGGERVSVFQPHWSPQGVLHFVADPTGWWNLYRLHEGQIEPLYEIDAEFGVPQWVFGLSTYDFLPDGHIVCAYCRAGIWQLARLDPDQHTLNDFPLPYTWISQVHTAGDSVVFQAASPTEPAALFRFHPLQGTVETLRRTLEASVDLRYFSIPQPIGFPTTDGETAFGYFYPPANPDFTAPPGEKPPLLVIMHGGPTSATPATLRYPIQFWTSRGFAVLDVNYRGSTGFGRPYRERLNGQWGVVDVADCVHGARFLAEQGQVDPQRMAIRGGSAGGYTTLAALAFYEIFQAGAAYYGVSDLEALAQETHKFESRYLDRLIGPYPEAREIYRARSPIYHLEKIRVPLILFQGLEDRIVPPNQSERIYQSLRARGLKVDYLAFPGESHGFCQAETQRRCLEAELEFYSQVFGFPLEKGTTASEERTE